eukprot:TRINITY_DN4520_c0_g1_i2.p1 TRINITY_DN4520_c0_g1~~TRINITY_DN4520_c0_g1_i2.p1  ORF type:complete len:615 (-),score=203.61 TRINITY_DN4520_c0_g1_i2:81-1688(-)
MKLESVKQRSDIESSLINKPRAHLLKQKKPHESCDTEQFLECIRIVISRHGGSTHFETILEFVKQRLPRMRRTDGSPFTNNDFKKRIISVINGKPNIFSPDHDSDDCWKIRKEESPLTNYDQCIPLYQFILSFVESKDDYCAYDDIRRYIKSSWPVPLLKGEPITEEELEDAIHLNIETHPTIKQYDQGGMLIMTRKRRRTEPKKPKKQEESLDYYEGEGSVYNDSPLPPVAAPQVEKGPRKVKAKSKVEANDGPWIQCEKCSDWIEARTDTYITDLWVYDDENPNHLVYWCPGCRTIHGSPTPPGSGKKKRGGPGRGKTKSKAQDTPMSPPPAPLPQTPSVQTAKQTTAASLVEQNDERQSANSSGRRNPKRSSAKKDDKHSSSTSSSSSSSVIGRDTASTFGLDASQLSSLNIDTLDAEMDAELQRLVDSFDSEATTVSDPNDPNDGSDLKSVEKKELLQRLRSEVQMFKERLSVARDELIRENNARLESNIERLRREREASNSRVEQGLAKQFFDFYAQRKHQLLSLSLTPP